MLLSWIFRKSKPYNKTEILNHGLKLAMSFGNNWLKPIQSRLAKKFPDLTLEELNEYNSICQEAMRYGHKLMYSHAEVSGAKLNQEQFNSAVLNEYPWLNIKTLSHLYSQSAYYVYKDFGF